MAEEKLTSGAMTFTDGKRETWPDAVKIIACVLVAVGHFTQSMITSGFIAGGALSGWFLMTIYSFHVPLFFICSGYLYQRYSRVTSIGEWWLNIRKKALVLGIPYFFFTLVTLALKAIAREDVNSIGGGPVETLLFHPTSPYWFLYTLFFVFLVVPTAVGQRSMLGILFAGLSLKIVSLIGGGVQMPYAISSMSANLIWFTLGMGLAFWNVTGALNRKTVGIGALFAPLSIFVYALIPCEFAKLIVGIFACLFVVSLCVVTTRGYQEGSLFHRVAQLTMPVFLMHTLFAAGMRVLLLRLGVTSLALHVSLGLSASFFGPALAFFAMERIGHLDFLVFPNRYIRVERTC